jgi:hypothetical protein
VRTPDELQRKMWRLIEALAVARVFLYQTNISAMPNSTPGCGRKCSRENHRTSAARRMTRATERGRQDWVRDFPDVVLPAKKDPPFRRDHRLPVRD